MSSWNVGGCERELACCSLLETEAMMLLLNLHTIQYIYTVLGLHALRKELLNKLPVQIVFSIFIKTYFYIFIKGYYSNTLSYSSPHKFITCSVFFL